MDTIKQQLLRRLADGRFCSGEVLARELGMSRAAIWKQLKSIEEIWGIGIESVKGKGYRLQQGYAWLDAARICGDLSPMAAAILSDIIIHDSIDSTNSWLMSQVSAGLASATVCLAEHQSSGRGRHGRQWVSPFGSSIYLSILWRYPLAPMQLSGLSLACGVAVARALNRLGIDKPSLKWPNDILWERRKLAGLLLEVGGEATGPCHVVVGLGLNIHLPEAQTLAIEQPWVDLASIAHTLPSQRNHIAALLISELIEAMAVYGESGLASFTEDWSRFDHFQGEQVMLRMGSQDIRGIYQGINQNGAMRLLIDGQSRCYNAGEISLCRAVA